MLPYIAEFLGTMMLIILGDGVVANVNLNKSGMKGAGAVQITLAWGLAVLVPAFIFGEASGASFNPALTIALAVDGSFAWSMVPGYVIAQMAGAFVGASIVYLLFKGQFDATEDPGTKLGVFCTGPSIPNTGLNILSEAVGTFILVFAIKGIGNVTGLSTGVDKLFVFGIIVSVGMSLGGLTGYAIKRDCLLWTYFHTRMCQTSLTSICYMYFLFITCITCELDYINEWWSVVTFWLICFHNSIRYWCWFCCSERVWLSIPISKRVSSIGATPSRSCSTLRRNMTTPIARAIISALRFLAITFSMRAAPRAFPPKAFRKAASCAR